MSIDFDTALRAIFSECGLDDPEGSLHGWRCAHPDRFPGYCHCVDDLVTDVKEAHERALADATKPRTLTADDPEPAVGSVVLDGAGDAWLRFQDGLWRMAGWQEAWDYGFVWAVAPLRLIHDGGQA